MSDFETILKIIAEGLALVFIPVAAVAAIAAIRVIWRKGSTIGAGSEDLESLRTRIEELEQRGITTGEVIANDSRIAELEERLDFAERLLAQRSEPAQLPDMRTPV